MRLPGENGHLTYCTNVHRGETWDEVWRVLQNEVQAVRLDVAAPDQAFAIGLRLSGVALDEASEPDAFEQMKGYLADNNCYIPTLNAFPYGPFHGTRVKEDVYLPDWRDEERLRYTNASADYLAEILPEGMPGSVSTAPGAFKTNVTSLETVANMADRFLRHAAHLVELERRTGRSIALAVEPEPSCFLETTTEAITFFEDHLFSRAAAERLSELTDVAPAEAESALRKHLGLCLDLCHAAVEYEEPAEVYAALRAAGLNVAKMQVSAGLRLATLGHNTRALLKPFDDGVYLHQVIERRNGDITRYSDLGQAFAALDASSGLDGREWRVHYHIPLFLDDLGAFSSTQSFVREALALHRRDPISQHLEVETYTWGVLPERYRTTAIAPAIARELQWVRRQFPA
jgi:sugar phosphate isomerase/epimerase